MDRGGGVPHAGKRKRTEGWRHTLFDPFDLCSTAVAVGCFHTLRKPLAKGGYSPTVMPYLLELGC